MLTAPRPVPTLARSLATFRAAGFDDTVTLFADNSVVPEPSPLTHVVASNVRLGNMKNWVRALNGMVTQDADLIAIMQDDITWALNSRIVLHREIEAMGKMLRNVGYLSLYLADKHAKGSKQWGKWHVSHADKAIGALCYVLPVHAARKLAIDQVFASMAAERDHNDDIVVSQCLRQLGFELWFRRPAMVNHTLGSGNSSMFKMKLRDTRYWQAVAS